MIVHSRLMSSGRSRCRRKTASSAARSSSYTTAIRRVRCADRETRTRSLKSSAQGTLPGACARRQSVNDVTLLIGRLYPTTAPRGSEKSSAVGRLLIEASTPRLGQTAVGKQQTRCLLVKGIPVSAIRAATWLVLRCTKSTRSGGKRRARRGAVEISQDSSRKSGGMCRKRGFGA